jgi:hypothetical protein
LIVAFARTAAQRVASVARENIAPQPPERQNITFWSTMAALQCFELIKHYFLDMHMHREHEMCSEQATVLHKTTCHHIIGFREQTIADGHYPSQLGMAD